MSRSLTFALALALVACRDRPSTARLAPVVEEPRAEERPEVTAWVVPYEDSLESLERHASVLSTVSPTYFRLAVNALDARLEDWDPGVPFPRARLARIRTGASFSVLPMVGCIGECGPKISRVLDDAAARRRHVADLTRAVGAEHADGLYIDYEDIDARPESVTAFFGELGAALHLQDKKLGVAVQEPCGFNPACKREPYPFDLRELAKKVDRLAIMEYDFSVDGSSAPAPRAWVERGLRRVIDDVGAETARARVLCAVPYYGRMTAGLAGAETAVMFAEVGKSRIRNVDAGVGPLVFDPSSLAKVGPVRVIGADAGQIFFEDHTTLEARLQLIRALPLRGVAIWRLGKEDRCNVDELARFRRLSVPPRCP